MYYVPDGTKTCGYYECKKCGNRFLSLQTMEKIPCPDCEAEVDYEIGPGESLEDVLDTAVLLQRIEGEEEVEKMDALLSLAITGGGNRLRVPRGNRRPGCELRAADAAGGKLCCGKRERQFVYLGEIEKQRGIRGKKRRYAGNGL